MTPHLLENWYQHLGRPAWFWPAVFAVLALLMAVSSSADAWEVLP